MKTEDSLHLAPIILFVYNRLNHTKRLVESLKQNIGYEQYDFYIYSDGPKEGLSANDDVNLVDEVRAYIRSINGFASVHILEREKNIGLAANVIDGVTTLVNQYGTIIVLEDDLVLSPYFLQFMQDALDMYKDNALVGHIQACDFTGNPNLPDTFFINWTGSWGWATWARAWKQYQIDGESLLKELLRRKLTTSFDFDGHYSYTKMLRKQIQRKNDSWAIRWYASLFLSDMLALNVGHSLVQNRGFDGTGTHSGGGGLFVSSLSTHPLKVKEIAPVVVNKQARKAYCDYYRTNYGFWPRVRRRLKRTLHGDFGR